jgi:anti-sigma-K factor RskA
MECPLENGNGAELIVAYGARTLAPEAEAAFVRHMASCSNCREMAAAQQAVWLALDAWAPEPISSNFDERLYQRIATEEQGTWWQRLVRANWSWRPAMPVAAACAVMIAAFLIQRPASPPAPQSQSQPPVRIEQVQRALDDIEMLKQLGVESTTEKTRSSEKM